jgi:hypothetical protein
MEDAETVFARAKTRWADAGSALPEGPMDSISLARALEAARVEGLFRYVPTHFTWTESLAAYPRSREWRWRSAEEVLRAESGQGVILRLPLFWQMEIPLFLACRAAGSFLFVNDRANMPLGASAVARSSMATVATDAEDAEDFALYMQERSLSAPKRWLVVQHGSLRRLPRTLDAGLVFQEYHVLPGVPVLAQCEHLANREGLFHPLEEYAWEYGPDSRVTGDFNDPLPLCRFRTNLQSEPAGSCLCRRNLVSVRNS